MTAPELVPRRPLGGVIAVWVLAALFGVVIGVIVPVHARGQWIAVAMGVCVIASFVVQFWKGRSDGFLRRAALSTVGAFLVLGLVGLGFGLSRLLPT
ncbi:hypothetical protein AB1K54_13965 [Microbacterium sp. BWT-B31]|uniref:hypothetical protein n=1 Tax=Microbacterium sp. BWT-B31 TaxID=3232072 RepID=UPI0035285583